MSMRSFCSAALVAALLGAGCSSDNSAVGDGTAPTALYVGVSAPGEGALTLPECTAQTLKSFLEFDHGAGDTGDFTERSEWRSSDPSTAFVGDGVSPSPDGVVYPKGYVVGIKPGAAVVTASYLEFEASMTVEVPPLQSLVIEPALTDIAENVAQKFDLKAVFLENTADQDVSSTAQWRFAATTTEAYANANGGGQVQANSATSTTPLELVAEMPECGREVSTQFRVSQIEGLDLDYEFGDEPVLPLGYSEAVAVQARFASPDGSETTRQNLSSVVEIENDDDDYISVSRGEDALYVVAGDDAADVFFDVSLDTESRDFFIPTKIWKLQDIALLDVHLSPQELRITYPETGQFTVTGTFEDGRERPITRHVSWTSSDTVGATVSAAYDSAGEVSVGNVDIDVEIEASSADAEGTQDFDLATVKVFSSESTN